MCGEAAPAARKTHTARPRIWLLLSNPSATQLQGRRQHTRSHAPAVPDTAAEAARAARRARPAATPPPSLLVAWLGAAVGWRLPLGAPPAAASSSPLSRSASMVEYFWVWPSRKSSCRERGRTEHGGPGYTPAGLGACRTSAGPRHIACPQRSGLPACLPKPAPAPSCTPLLAWNPPHSRACLSITSFFLASTSVRTCGPEQGRARGRGEGEAAAGAQGVQQRWAGRRRGRTGTQARVAQHARQLNSLPAASGHKRMTVVWKRATQAGGGTL